MRWTHPAYDEAAFESVLGIREATDHSKLMEVLDVINDPEVTSEALLSGSFNEDNLLTYAALSILMGNVEGTVTDYSIYSPRTVKPGISYLKISGMLSKFQSGKAMPT